MVHLKKLALFLGLLFAALAAPPMRASFWDFERSLEDDETERLVQQIKSVPTHYTGIALVNQGTGGLGVTGSASSGTTVAATLSQHAVAGNCLVCFYSIYTQVLDVSSISGGGVTWTKLVSGTDSAHETVAIWYGLNSSGSGTSITVTAAGTITGFANITVCEFSGVATSSAVDIAGTFNSGNGTAITTNSITPTAGLNELILATSRGSAANSAGPTNSFIALNGASSQGCAYLIVSSTSGSYSTGWTQSGSFNWGSDIGSLKAPAPAGGPVQVLNENQMCGGMQGMGM